MGFTDGRPLPIRFLFVFFVMAMVSVHKVLELAYLTLEVGSFDFGVM